jgi:hypothetical protein
MLKYTVLQEGGSSVCVPYELCRNELTTAYTESRTTGQPQFLLSRSSVVFQVDSRATFISLRTLKFCDPLNHLIELISKLYQLQGAPKLGQV